MGFLQGYSTESEAGPPKQRCMSARKPLGVAAANQVSRLGEGPDGVGVNCIFPGRLWILGTEHDTKTDEFSEKFQTAFDHPHPIIFGKSYCGFCDKIATKVGMFIMAGLLCI